MRKEFEDRVPKGYQCGTHGWLSKDECIHELNREGVEMIKCSKCGSLVFTASELGLSAKDFLSDKEIGEIDDAMSTLNYYGIGLGE